MTDRMARNERVADQLVEVLTWRAGSDEVERCLAEFAESSDDPVAALCELALTLAARAAQAGVTWSIWDPHRVEDPERAMAMAQKAQAAFEAIAAEIDAAGAEIEGARRG